ncbi:MAG: type II toxin-antitoxin system RelE/ParE family toxin [Sphingomonas sp.]|uniref:type II toxin-antitoxin system RelE/ParE family toxin n=1 Tax=Sphingomonas sp. TaxID=28214 RepID=UPI0017D9A9D2|nr:plasmid stabilization protein ParE [Zymomonas sp.]MBA4771937.1 type II toxin-antitoxin system RelE/ParE family toxin [Sphingomonas sp.]
MRLKLGRRAENDLADIRDYSIEQFGVERAIAYLDGIEAAFRLIMDYPEIGGVHLKVTPPVRSYAVQLHRIFYSVEADVVLIVRVLHKAMDVGRWL